MRTPLTRFSWILAATMLASVLAGCGADDDGAAPDTGAPRPTESTASTEPATEPSAPAGDEPTSSDTSPTDPALAAVPEILDFEGTTVDGAAFEGASVAGRPVVVWFWAPWCAVCRSQAPMVTDLAEEYGDRLTVLGIGSLDSADAIAGFVDEAPGVTHLSDPDGELWTRFGIAEQSSFVVLDAEGDEVLRTGYADDDALGDAVAEVT